MKAAFSAEAIGLDTSMEIFMRMAEMPRLAASMRPWVAELTGLSDRYGFDRRFVKPKADYTQANSKGTRGVWFWWTLESGHVYEAKYRTTWNDWHRAYLTVSADGELTELTAEEVRAWLASADSASTS